MPEVGKSFKKISAGFGLNFSHFSIYATQTIHCDSEKEEWADDSSTFIKFGYIF